MLITVNLLSPIVGEIKKFFSDYLETECNIDEYVVEWIYVYRDLPQALDVINLFMDHIEKYRISLWVQIGDDDIFQMKKRNREDVTEKIEYLIAEQKV